MKTNTINMFNTKQNPAFGAYKVPRSNEGYAIIDEIGKHFPTYGCKRFGDSLIVHTSEDSKQCRRILFQKSLKVFKKCLCDNAKMLGLVDVKGKSKDEIGKLVTFTLEDYSAI